MSPYLHVLSMTTAHAVKSSQIKRTSFNSCKTRLQKPRIIFFFSRQLIQLSASPATFELPSAPSSSAVKACVGLICIRLRQCSSSQSGMLGKELWSCGSARVPASPSTRTRNWEWACFTRLSASHPLGPLMDERF